MVVVPADTPVTIPFASTVAILVFEELQIISAYALPGVNSGVRRIDENAFTVSAPEMESAVGSSAETTDTVNVSVLYFQ